MLSRFTARAPQLGRASGGRGSLPQTTSVLRQTEGGGMEGRSNKPEATFARAPAKPVTPTTTASPTLVGIGTIEKPQPQPAHRIAKPSRKARNAMLLRTSSSQEGQIALLTKAYFAQRSPPGGRGERPGGRAESQWWCRSHAGPVALQSLAPVPSAPSKVPLSRVTSKGHQVSKRPKANPNFSEANLTPKATIGLSRPRSS